MDIIAKIFANRHSYCLEKNTVDCSVMFLQFCLQYFFIIINILPKTSLFKRVRTLSDARCIEMRYFAQYNPLTQKCRCSNWFCWFENSSCIECSLVEMSNISEGTLIHRNAIKFRELTVELETSWITHGRVNLFFSALLVMIKHWDVFKICFSCIFLICVCWNWILH